MEISFYSIFMAAMTSSVLILLLHFVYKIKGLNRYFGLAGVIALYFCSLIRMFVPIEFSKVNIEIPDKAVFPVVVKFLNYPVFEPYVEYQQMNTFLYMHLISIIMVVVSLVLILRFIKNFRSFKKQIMIYPNFATPREEKIFGKVCKELGINKKIDLIVIDENISPMTFGLRSPIVLLPCNDFNNNELKFIYRHELNHFKNHDSLLKLLVEIYCCVFWWNPFVYLLRHDISQKLEIKCDSRTTVNCTEYEKMTYLSAILKCMKQSASKKKADKPNMPSKLKNLFITAKLAAASSENRIKERFDYIMNPPSKRFTSVIFNILIFVLCASILLYSYVFIIRPCGGDPPPEAVGSGRLLDNDEVCLAKQPDGGYFLTIHGKALEYITSEEYDTGEYAPYAVIEQ